MHSIHFHQGSHFSRKCYTLNSFERRLQIEKVNCLEEEGCIYLSEHIQSRLLQRFTLILLYSLWPAHEIYICTLHLDGI